MEQGYRIASLWSTLCGPSRITWQCLAVHSSRGQIEMAQGGRRDVDQRGAAVMGARRKPAAGDEEERALLVSAETAMYAKSGAVLWFERVAHDVAVAGHAVRIGARVGLEGQRDLHRSARRQTRRFEIRTDEHSADPVLGFEKARHLRDETARWIGEIEQCSRAVRRNDDVR